MRIKFIFIITAFFLSGLTVRGFVFTAGDLDNTFGSAGVVTTTFPNSTLGEATDIVVQPDGKLIVSAFANGVSGLDIVLARYNPNGSPDASFSGDGVVTTPFGGEFDSANAVALQPDGKILTAGRIGISPSRFAVLRFNPDGTPDPTFGGDGIVTAQILQNAVAGAVGVQADGRIIVAGSAVNNGNEDFFVVVRYNSDGSIDSSFGNAGTVFASFGQIDFFSDLIIQNDGKILAVGTGNASSQTPLLAMIRLNPNGSFDTGFNGTGHVAAQIPLFEQANSVALQNDGKIVIGGQRGGSFSVFRFNPNGVLDTTFDADGIASADFNIFSSARDVKIQPDGKIIGVGETFGEGTDFAIARFSESGAADNTFGVGGKIVSAISSDDDKLNRLAIQADGKIVGAGVSGAVGNKKITLARYLGDAAAPRAKFDFDGDGRADLSVFRPAAGNWFINNSSNVSLTAVQFGASGDLIAPADFDGDGKTDICVFRPADGGWYRLNSSNNTFSAQQFGASGDLPAPGDFDGDRRADLTVYRPSSGTWFRINSSDSRLVAAQFGSAEDKPIADGDFDGDGKADVAVFRPSTGDWYRLNSSNGQFVGIHFGAAGDKPVAADYDGDGKTDLAVWRAGDGVWYRLDSGTDSFTVTQFGASQDKPVPADYDGDGRADLAVFRPSEGIWYLLRSQAGFTGAQFGANGDVPTPNSFVR